MLAKIARLAVVSALVATAGTTAVVAADPVVATVNGSEIRKSDVLRARHRLPASRRNLPDEQIVPILTDIVVNSRLVADQARESGLAYEPQVRAQINLITDEVLEQNMLAKVMKEKVSDAAIRARYDKIAQDKAYLNRVRARHIQVEDAGSARDIIDQLNAGSDFSQLAKTYSKDANADAGGDLGYFSRGEFTTPFSDAAFSLQPGEYTREPVQTEYGWHVILVEDRRTFTLQPFDQARDEIRALLAREVRNDYVKSLRERASVRLAGE